MIPDPRQERQNWKDHPGYIEASEVMGQVWTGDFSNAELRDIRRSINQRIEWLKEHGEWPTNCQNCGQVVRVWDEHAKYKEEIDGKVTLGWNC